MGNTNTKSSPSKKSSPAVIQSALLVKPLLRSSGLGKLNVLPDDVVLVIFSFLTYDDLLKISSVSNVFYILSQKDLLWRGIAQDTGWKSQETMGPREYLHGRISQFNIELLKLYQALNNIDNLSRNMFMTIEVEVGGNKYKTTLSNTLAQRYSLVRKNNIWENREKPLGPIKDIVPVLKLLPALNAFFNQVYLLKKARSQREIGITIFEFFYHRMTSLLARGDYIGTATSPDFLKRITDYLATKPASPKILLLDACISSADFLAQYSEDRDSQKVVTMLDLIGKVERIDARDVISNYAARVEDILKKSGLSRNAALDKRFAEIKNQEQAVKRFNRNM